MQTTVEEVRDQKSNNDAGAATDWSKLEAAEASRARALTLADAAAAEAAELRREVELAHERVGELAEALAQARPLVSRSSIASRASRRGQGSGGGLEIAGPASSSCLPAALRLARSR